MRTRYLQILLFVMSIIFLAGCGQNQGNDGRLALIKTINPKPLQINNDNRTNVKKFKQEMNSFPEVYDVAVIKGKKETLVAYKVKHLYRFKMKAVEKKMTDQLKKRYPKENFIVSSDYKIFLEAVRLQEDMQKPGLSKKKAEERLQEIITLKGETT